MMLKILVKQKMNKWEFKNTWTQKNTYRSLRLATLVSPLTEEALVDAMFILETKTKL